jgi:glycosyltransferase involved in cell wall biosynthesis
MSVVLPTRDRANVVANAVRTILQNDYPDFELVVVDQSDSDSTATALEPFFPDKRLHYLRTSARGRSAGQNAGFREARGRLVLVTDDDCTVPADWLRRFAAAFAEDSRIGVVFGNVLAGPEQSGAGRIPTYLRSQPFLARRLPDKLYVEGISSCLGVRRDVWEELGGFDEMLGVGGRFKAGEEGDIALRALLHGYWVYETPAVAATHHGFRKWEAIPALIESYWYGTGALMAKAVKAGHWAGLGLLLRLGGKWMTGRSMVAASLGRRETARKLLSFSRGFGAGARVRVEKGTGLYTEDPAA